MSAPDGTDTRHPAWCSWRLCTITTGQGSDHRSETVPIERVHDYDVKASVWLTMHAFEPPETAEIWLHLRVEEIGVDGEPERVTTEDFHLVQAEQLGSVLVLLSRRGAERRLVSEDEWRTTAPRPRPAGPGDPGNSGPGWGPMPGETP